MFRTLMSTTRTLLLLPLAIPAFAQTPAPPAAGAAASSPLSVQGLNVVPKNGQNRDQQWKDRYACDTWSRSQSGFDPSQPGTTAGPNDSRHDEYRRAMAACLEAHGYAVTAAPPPPPPLPVPVPVVVTHSTGIRYHPFLMQLEGGYTITQDAAAKALDNGWNAGLGFTWFPSSALPLGFRVDGSYSRFNQTTQSLNQASQIYNANVAFGHLDSYGGDLDLELDLRLGPNVKEYFFGGVGRYRERTHFDQVTYQRGVVCYFQCFPAYIGYVSTVAENTTGWLNSWNAGIGFEFALRDPARFFVEARYQRILPSNAMSEFVPIRFGLRF
jgi:hypothetical protein